jgi:hypothetical protein
MTQVRGWPRFVLTGALALTGVAVPVALATNANGAPKPPPGPSSSTAPASTINGSTGGFSFGQLQASAVMGSGCGTNSDGEPAIHVSSAGNVFMSSERGLGGGSDAWRGLGQGGGSSAQACSLQYLGQPNAVQGTGASGGDTDLAIASAPNALGNLNVYVASLNLGSVAVATSQDNGATFTNVPVQGGLPLDDREWIAAYGAATSLLSFHDITTNDIDVLRSDSSGTGYTEISQAIPETDYKASNNEIGKLVVDRQTTSGVTAGPQGQAGFWAFQAFVAPSKAPATPLTTATNNEAWLAVSHDGGYTWSDQPVPCSVTSSSTANGLDHQFPIVSVAPNGSLWMTWSDDRNVFTASSPAPAANNGQTSWTCSGPVSTTTSSGQAIEPWIVATSSGVDLVYYASPTLTNTATSQQQWFVYFAQDVTSTATGWATPIQLMAVHLGSVCETGATCTSGRQLFDDFGVDTDPAGWAHIAYSHDAPDLGGSGTFTGYAVQTSGTPVGAPN